MTDALAMAVAEVLPFLLAIEAEQVPPPEAQARLRPLRARHPLVPMELVWQEEAYDRGLAYDVLLVTPRAATVAIGAARGRGVAWPLRGTHRWSEADLVRVNSTVLKVPQAIACLDFVWDEAPLLARLIDVCLIQEELAARPIELSDQALQAGLDAFRRQHQLYDAAATERWMAARGITHAQLEHLIADNLLLAGVRDRVSAGRVEAYFALHRAAFDVARIAYVEFPDEASAWRFRACAQAGSAAFVDAAMASFRAGEVPPPVFVVFRGDDPRAALAAAVFAAAVETIVGPLPLGASQVVAVVLAFEPAVLDEPTRAAVEAALLRRWLDERARAAHVEWNWGRSAG